MFSDALPPFAALHLWDMVMAQRSGTSEEDHAAVLGAVVRGHSLPLSANTDTDSAAVRAAAVAALAAAQPQGGEGAEGTPACPECLVHPARVVLLWLALTLAAAQAPSLTQHLRGKGGPPEPTAALDELRSAAAALERLPEIDAPSGDCGEGSGGGVAFAAVAARVEALAPSVAQALQVASEEAELTRRKRAKHNRGSSGSEQEGKGGAEAQMEGASAQGGEKGARPLPIDPGSGRAIASRRGKKRQTAPRKGGLLSFM